MPSGRKRRTVGVCTSCRQDKVRCDSEVSFPCSRCVARGSTCAIDPKFQRTPARQRLQTMADELRQLKGAQSPPGMSSSMEQSLSPGRSFSAQLSEDCMSSDGGLMALPSSDSFYLGFQSFTADQVNRRFSIYFEHFHPRLPILDLEKHNSDLYQDCPILFWAIIAISCRREPMLDHDQALFFDNFLSLLRSTALATPLSLYTIQALTIICTWPMPIRHHLCEPGWLYYSLALGGATYLNLDTAHRLGQYQASRLPESDILNMSRTWLGIFCTGISFATWPGVDMTLKQPSDLAVIDAHINSQIPSQLCARAALARVSAKHGSQTKETLSIITHEALIDLAVAELESVSVRFSEIWTPELNIIQQATKLSFITSLLVTFSKLRDRSSSPEISSNCFDGKLARHIMMGSHIAAEIIAKFDILIGYGSDFDPRGPSSTFFSLPKTFFHALMFTSFFLIRFCCTNSLCSPEYHTAGCQAIELAQNILLRASRDPLATNGGDEPARASRVLGELLQYQQDHAVDALTIDDSGSRFIVCDTASRIRVLRGENTRDANLLHLINPRASAYDAFDSSESSADESVFEQLDLEFMQQFLDVDHFDALAGMAGPS